MSKKGSHYWDRQLAELIDNNDLRKWIASIIWFDKNNCCLHHGKANEEKSRKLHDEWDWFDEKYIDGYDIEHDITLAELEAGMKLIGYKFTVTRNMLNLFDRRIKNNDIF